MHPRTARYLATAVLLVAPLFPVQAQSGPPDTIDVKVGSTLVNFPEHQPGAQRAVTSMVVNGQTRTGPPMVWAYRFDDSGGEPRIFVQGKPEGAAPQGAGSNIFVFNRKSLAFEQMLSADGSTVMLTVDGASVHGETPGPSGNGPVDFKLDERAFLKPLANLLAESLPRRMGVVYRVPLWSMSPTPFERHLYQFVRQEDVEVLGRSYAKAWVMEDRSAAGTLMSTMWLVDSPPELVRWVLNKPGGQTVKMELEPAGSSR